ncbi:MAG: dihydroorotate dehydrogenase electron transfer subunit [Massiliimalia sp.]
MEYVQGEYRIDSKKNLAKNIYDYVIVAQDIAQLAQPGQFVHIKVQGFQLRRPISICEIDRDKGTIRIVFEVRGEGTEALARLNEGQLVDVMGPLGKGFTILDPSKKIIVVGGGIGVPPMFEVAKHYGANATAITGFRSANAVILAEDFKRAGTDHMLCTDDGTMGAKGFVTVALKHRLLQEHADMIYACGPHVMLKGVVQLAEEFHIPCEVSLEERMGCGVGACLVCACKTVKDGKEYLSHVCKDGPVFRAEDVIW